MKLRLSELKQIIANELSAIVESSVKPNNASLTGYYPLDTATKKERDMEGNPIDMREYKLYYLEDAIAGKKIPYVSVAGDPKVFKYGQLIKIDKFPNIKFRVVDTGDMFSGDTKKIRHPGHEPLDIAVRKKGAAFKLPPTAKIVVVTGDDFSGKPVKSVADKIKLAKEKKLKRNKKMA
jgi:hypothetical protein